MGAAGRKHRAVGLKVPTSHHNDTVAELAVDALIVELLEDLLKVARKIHGPTDMEISKQKSLSEHIGNTVDM